MTRDEFLWWFVIVNWEKLGTRALVEADKAWHTTLQHTKRKDRG